MFGVMWGLSAGLSGVYRLGEYVPIRKAYSRESLSCIG